jgi:protein dithiol:quinone oxidoreductase
MPSRRMLYALGFLVCAGLIGFALYLQHVLGEDPCPLCIFQRVAVIALGVISLVAALHNPGRAGTVVYGALLTLVAGIGAAIAGRHVWLQHLPKDQVPDCGPGLEYIMQAFPFSKAVRMVFEGSGECAEVGWRFLGLSIPEWTLIWFVLFTVAAIAQIWNPKR